MTKSLILFIIMKILLKKILYIGAFIFFFTYWSITLLYCSPNNFVRAEFNTSMKLFEAFFYQRWTFFTPPPKTNERVYFLYVDKKNPNIMTQCEVLKPIQDKKRENPIINNTFEVLDDIIGGAVAVFTILLLKPFVSQNSDILTQVTFTIEKVQ
jgi:hypothetical protein